jgi:hypothetical protein
MKLLEDLARMDPQRSDLIAKTQGQIELFDLLASENMTTHLKEEVKNDAPR